MARRALVLAIIAATMGGCTGTIETGPAGPGGNPRIPPGTTPGPGPSDPAFPRHHFRRMERSELVASAAVLLRADERALAEDASALAEDPRGASGFATPHPMSEAYAGALFDVADAWSARIEWSALDAEWAGRCIPSASDEARCARELVTRFGARAFRRPPADAEIDELVGVFSDLRTGTPALSYDESLRATVSAMLAAPQTLYLWELAPGTSEDVDDHDRARLTGPELVAALSFVLFGHTPDDAWLARGAALDTGDATARAALVDEMLADPRSAHAFEVFFETLFGVDTIDDVVRVDPEGGALSAAVRSAMREEFRDYVARVLGGPEPTWSGLLLGEHSTTDADLRSHYGSESGPRVGVLTLGSVLTVHANDREPSPTHFGKMVRTTLLCDVVRPPPPEIDTSLPEPAAGTTLRERLEAHTSDAVCASCHMALDPIGFAVLDFDHLGRPASMPEDTSGYLLDGPGGETAAFDDAAGLAGALAATEKASACLAWQWLNRISPRSELTLRDPRVAALGRDLWARGGDLRALLRAVAMDDTLLYRESVTR